MTHNTDFFNQIEDYCLKQLKGELKQEFEAELILNPELRNEVELLKDLQAAIEESDILNLRGKLEDITGNIKSIDLNNGSFKLVNEFSDIKDISEVLSSEELISFYDSLPKAHVYQHEITSNENIHHFYKKQRLLETNEDVNGFDDIDLNEFEDLGEAILEKDIIELRQTLKQVAKSVDGQFSVEEIDKFMNDELSAGELMDFENELDSTQSLQNELALHIELENAINEDDIINLRTKLASIINAETSWNVSERNIEDFIDGVLDGVLLEQFEAELQDNTDLRAEVNLRKQINEFLGEDDIQKLRSELYNAQEKAEVRKVKMLIPESSVNNFKFWRSSVAIVIILLGIAGVLRNGLVSFESVYDSYFESPSWSPERSLLEDVNYLQQANFAYMKGDFLEVINIFEKAPPDMQLSPVSLFFRASSLQNTGKLEDAISGYTLVIEHGDNIFIEEAEWYRSLCNLKLRNKNIAKIQLFAIVKRNGYYEQDAKAILRRIKYKLE